MSEGEIQSEILQALKRVGIQAMRINSGMAKVRGGWLQLAPEGTADLIVFPRGKCPVWLEIKSEKGKQGEAQREFETNVRNLGHGYFVLRGLDDLMPLLKEMR